MNALLKAAAVFAAGAAAMYYLDPETVRRRRVLARERGQATARELEQSARGASRHASNRVRGAVAEAKSHAAHGSIDDDRLHDHIRAKLGHLMDRPSAVVVKVDGGHVVLSGHAPDDEAAALARYVAGMRGVADVDNRLSAGDGSEQGTATH